MPIDITVAICTFNGEKRLPKVLDCLSQQIETAGILWEVLVIDNASQDNTRDLIHRYQKIWGNTVDLRYSYEQKQGAAFARAKAVQDARGDLIAFVDDDNLLAPNWIKEAYKFAKDHPSVGAFGGQNHGQFEADLPPYFKIVKSFLAITEHGNQPYEYTPESRMFPPGAGLVVRRRAWLEAVPKTLSLSGRVSNSLMAGEDLEVLAYLQKAGWKIWYNPKMELNHVIPQYRLEEDYLLRLAWGTGLCRHHIRLARYNWFYKIIFTPLHIIYDLGSLLAYLLRGQFKAKYEFSRKFETTYRLGTLISTFYFIKCQIVSAIAFLIPIRHRSNAEIIAE